jgi:hypothetical protein
VVGRDEALRALQRMVTGHEFEHATVLEVTDGGPAGFLLRVRAGQRIHAHTLIVAADEQSLALEHSIGEPLESDDVETWADGVYYWLMEELDTGVLRWGGRVTLDDGTVAVDPSLEADASPQWWDVSEVPLDRPTRAGQRRLLWAALRARRRSFVTIGDHVPHEPDPTPGGYLREAGFEVGPGRAAHPRCGGHRGTLDRAPVGPRGRSRPRPTVAERNRCHASQHCRRSLITASPPVRTGLGHRHDRPRRPGGSGRCSYDAGAGFWRGELPARAHPDVR